METGNSRASFHRGISLRATECSPHQAASPWHSGNGLALLVAIHCSSTEGSHCVDGAEGSKSSNNGFHYPRTASAAVQGQVCSGLTLSVCFRLVHLQGPEKVHCQPLLEPYKIQHILSVFFFFYPSIFFSFFPSLFLLFCLAVPRIEPKSLCPVEGDVINTPSSFIGSGPADSNHP